jgi:NTP pyrophosphatase (non-canonical NTP hydrolase)
MCVYYWLWFINIKYRRNYLFNFYKEKLIKELGDIAWYLAEAAYALDINLSDVLEGNINKLKARYPEGFSVSKSINREDD